MSSPPTQPEKIKLVLIQLSELIKELIFRCHQEGKTPITPDMIGYAQKTFVENTPPENIMNNFIKYSYAYWKEVKERNEGFISENAMKIFGENVPADKINAFDVLFKSVDENGKPIIPDSDKEAIWVFFDTMIRISINHIHYSRDPIVQGGKKSYKNKVYLEVDRLSYYAKLFGVNIAWPN